LKLGERTVKDCVRPAVLNNDLKHAVRLAERRPINDNYVRLPKIDLPTFSGAYIL